ncbi:MULTISPECIES: secretion/conjugation apparatus DotM-related subunit [Cupriavidus]
MSTQKPQAKPTVDPFMLILGVGMIVLVAWLFWNKYHTAIATAYAYVRIAEFSIFVVLGHWISGVVGGVLAATGVAARFAFRPLRRYATPLMGLGGLLCGGWLVGSIFGSWFTFFVASDKSLIDFDHMTLSSLHANLFTVIVCIVPLAVWIGRRSLAVNPLNHKNFARPKPYTLHTYTDAMGQLYPHAKLFRKLKLTEKSVNEGKYRMPDTEKQFVLKHRLMDRAKVEGEYAVNRERAGVVFRGQLGKLWRRSWKELSRTELMTLAILVPRIAATDPDMPDHEYDAALEATNKLIQDCWKQTEAYDEAQDTFALSVDKALATLKQYAGKRKVREYLERHAYVSTIIYAMLTHARTLGVLQAAELRWLRVLDRRLFILVDNDGRQVAFTEVAGIYSHYLYELSRKKAAERPSMEGAVKGLIEAVDSFKFTDDERAKIEATLNADKPVVIDPKVIEKPISRVMLHILPVGHGASLDIFELALLAEDGKALFESRCRPRTPIEDIVDRYPLDDNDVMVLQTAPTSDELRRKVLELCNKQGVVYYGADLTALVPGIDRSAQSVQNLQTNTDHDLVMASIDEGVADPAKNPQVSSAHGGALMLRQLWVARAKRALHEQAEAARGKPA